MVIISIAQIDSTFLPASEGPASFLAGIMNLPLFPHFSLSPLFFTLSFSPLPLTFHSLTLTHSGFLTITSPCQSAKVVVKSLQNFKARNCRNQEGDPKNE